MKTCKVLDMDFNLISYEDVLEGIRHWRNQGEHHYITLTPPYSVLMCQRDAELRQATENATLTLPDGVGIILAARLLRYRHSGRVTGPMLMLRLCDWGRKEGLRHFFYGGAPGVADALAERLKKNYPGLQVAGTYCPPFRKLTCTEDKEIVEKINKTAPDVVWVGLGSPKQEKWMAEHVDRIKACALIGVGVAFDFHSGRVKWAPAWMRKMGLEWAHRLALDPMRMWRRNLNSFVFLAKVLQQCMQGSNGTWPHRETMEQGKLNYRSVKAAVLMASLIVLTFGVTYHTLAARFGGFGSNTPIASDALDPFPMQIGDWTGEAIPLDETIVDKTGTDAHINRRYSRRNGLETISLYVACGVKVTHLIAHRPEICYLGAGRSLLSRRSVELSLNDNTKLPCRVLQFTRGGIDADAVTVVDYFIVNGRYCADVSAARSQAGLRYTNAHYVAQVQIVASKDMFNDESAERLVCAFAVDSAAPIFKLFADIEKDRSSAESPVIPEGK